LRKILKSRKDEAAFQLPVTLRPISDTFQFCRVCSSVCTLSQQDETTAAAPCVNRASARFCAANIFVGRRAY